MKSTPTARWAGSHPTSTRTNGHNTTNNNQQPSKHPAHKTRPDQNLEFTTLELQRFQTLLKLHRIELHATFRRAGPAATHRHRDQASHPAITHVIAEPTPNSACNSPTTISNLEFTTLELQRFQTLLKLHRIELHATFRRVGPATAHGRRSQALGNLAVIDTGIPRGYPQALFLSDSYPQGSDSAWITRCHARSVDVDGPTRGPTKE